MVFEDEERVVNVAFSAFFFFGLARLRILFVMEALRCEECEWAANILKLVGCRAGVC